MFVSGSVTAGFQYLNGDGWPVDILPTGDISNKALLGLAIR